MKKRINLSWMGFALAATWAVTLTVSGIAKADELTLYAFPSPMGINWSSPHKLALTTVENEYAWTPHGNHTPIGHVSIELKCGHDASNSSTTVLTGMTATDHAEQRQLILHQAYGLGALFHTFRGRLESEQDVREALPVRYKDGSVAFLRYQINSRTCRRLLRYVTEYRERGYDQFYGLPNRPRYGEGGGCSAFGVSFLELAGLLDTELRVSWSKKLRVPSKWIGGPQTGNSVSLLSLLFPFERTAWAEPSEPGFDIFFWDPDTMYRWIRRKWSSLKDHAQPGIFPETRIKAQGLAYDRRSVPTPEDPIWKSGD